MVPEKCSRPARRRRDPIGWRAVVSGFRQYDYDRYAADAEDYICQPERFIEWCILAGAVRSGQHIAAPKAAGQRAALMRRLRMLRHHVDALLTSRIDGVPPLTHAVRVCPSAATSCLGQRSFERDGQMHWRDDASNVLLPLKRIALDALDLIRIPLCRSFAAAPTRGRAAGCSSIPARTSGAAGARWTPRHGGQDEALSASYHYRRARLEIYAALPTWKVETMRPATVTVD